MKNLVKLRRMKFIIISGGNYANSFETFSSKMSNRIASSFENFLRLRWHSTPRYHQASKQAQTSNCFSIMLFELLFLKYYSPFNMRRGDVCVCVCFAVVPRLRESRRENSFLNCITGKSNCRRTSLELPPFRFSLVPGHILSSGRRRKSFLLFSVHQTLIFLTVYKPHANMLFN